MIDANRPESLVLFEFGGHTCGVRSENVQSVEIPGPVTPVPNAAPFVDGVTLTRGQFIPSINLRVRFGLDAIRVNPQARMIVARAGVRTVGILVDSAREFISISSGDIGPPGERVAGFSARYVEGIATLGNRSVLLLDLHEVMEGL
jgi:chemotaxis signal transduction protein